MNIIKNLSKNTGEKGENQSSSSSASLSSRIGNLLLSLSRHSVLLRRFLGVRPAGEAVLVAALGMHAYDKTFSELSNPNTSVLRSMWLAARFGVCFAAAGSAVWRKADPVW